MLNKENFQFARQAGCSHVVVHLVDYFNQGKGMQKNNQPIGNEEGWGWAGGNDLVWELDSLRRLKKEIQEFGLTLEAIENFDPSHWHDVLLDGPQKKAQIEKLKEIIRNVGKAGIPVMGYNFSLAGVSSRLSGKFARGEAVSVGMDGVDDRPIPEGMVWNMRYGEKSPSENGRKEITHEELWSRLSYFLEELVPVAEESGVTLAAHPDDPPAPFIRKTPRLVYQPWMYQKLLDSKPSPSNALEFCLGSIAEMTEGDVYEATEKYARHIAYVHFRNVKGKVPHYREVFVDEGDIDMFRIIKILKEHHFNGVMIPDHTPQMTCDAPWYAGMAYALGYMKAAIQGVGLY